MEGGNKGLIMPQMENPTLDQSIGIPANSVSYAGEKLQGPLESPSSLIKLAHSWSSSKQNKKDYVVQWIRNFRKRAYNYVQGIKQHVSLGPKITRTVRGKQSLSARIIQAGGAERIFKQIFYVERGEKLVKASQCYLSTTAGPIAGILFISTEKIAFHSDRSLTLTSPKGELAKVPYKVLIPLKRIKEAISRENADKTNERYIQIDTVDDFEFWFMGFLCYERTFKFLKQAISKS